MLATETFKQINTGSTMRVFVLWLDKCIPFPRNLIYKDSQLRFKQSLTPDAFRTIILNESLSARSFRQACCCLSNFLPLTISWVDWNFCSYSGKDVHFEEDRQWAEVHGSIYIVCFMESLCSWLLFPKYTKYSQQLYNIGNSLKLLIYSNNFKVYA